MPSEAVKPATTVKDIKHKSRRWVGTFLVIGSIIFEMVLIAGGF